MIFSYTADLTAGKISKYGASACRVVVFSSVYSKGIISEPYRCSFFGRSVGGFFNMTYIVDDLIHIGIVKTNRHFVF